MEPRDYFGIVKKWWWLLLISTLVATGAGYLGVSRMPRTYRSTTTVIVGQSLNQPNPTNQDLNISQQLAYTYSNMVSRQPVLQGAAEALGLPYQLSPSNISASLVPGTQLLEISVRDTDARRAQAIADEIAQQLILQTPNEVAEDQARYEFVRTQLVNLEVNIQITEEEIQAEQQKLDAASSARAIHQHQVNIDALQEKLTSYRATYASLVSTVQDRTNYITVFEPANLPGRPVSPQVSETILLAAVTGLGLALVGAFAIELLDDTLKTPEDVQRMTSLPLLGTVARMRDKDPYASMPFVVQQPQSSISEAYRAVRVNIQVCSVDEPVRALMVTSPSAMEGKSTTVANLGVVMAQAGKKVILVDTDLRRATLHKLFQLSNSEGLTSILIHEDPSPDGLLRETSIDNLLLLTSGPLPPNPSELLGSQKMQQLIERLKEQADLIIFDAPPALPVADAMVLALATDGVVFVTDAGHTRRAAARQAIQKMQQVGANVLGIVLNRVEASRSHSYYYEQMIQNGAEVETRRRIVRRPSRRVWIRNKKA
ncbi:MAG: polysaccharide biosynthesis tyrosine autokinase [Anaerolineae bacterium]|nr:polysaccharide biosynthesis tyrosine autokinase [Anaerolineae bacterium]